MATKVQSIINAAESAISTYLAANSWSDKRKLRWAFSLEKNGLDDLRQAYAIIPQEAANSETAAGFYTLDHKFSLILSDVLGNLDDGDEKAFALLNDLYNKQDELFQEFVNTHLGLAGTVMHIFNPSLQQPILVGDTEAMIVIMDFEIKYRNALA